MAFHMSKGDGESSYSQNSGLQKMLQDRAVTPFLREPLATLRLPAESDAPVVVVDLGCASGPNTIAMVSTVIEQIKDLHSETDGKKSLEFQAFFNDLPSNDFNSLFQLLSSRDVKRSDFFAAGVPGTFYGPLFPPSTVHIFVSSSSLHYLSQIPASVMDKSSSAFNKGGWWVTGSVPSADTVEACKDQYCKDLDVFFGSRAEELVPGGLMLLASPSSWGGGGSHGTGKLEAFHVAFGLFDATLRELVKEGVLTEDKIDFYNIPAFLPAMADVKEVIRKHDSKLEIVTVKEVNIKVFSEGTDGSAREVVKVAMTMFRGGPGDLILGQIGKQAVELFWERFERKLVADLETLSGESPIMLVILWKKD